MPLILEPFGPPSGEGEFDPRDWGILEDIVARLVATNAYGDVHIAAMPEEVGFGADESIAAVVEPLDWAEPVEEFDDGSDVIVLFRFQVTILARGQDAAAVGKAADRLVSIARDAVAGKSLAGITFPATTRLKRGRWQTHKAPERRVVLQGECQYEVFGYEAHDTTDP